MQRFGNVLLHTRTAKREGELSYTPVRQDGMKQILWWDDDAQGQTKGLREVNGAGFIDELRMADGINSILIDPRVEESVVHIPDFLTDSNLVVKVGGICASSKEGVARIHGFDDRKVLTNSATRGSAFFCCSHSHFQRVTTWYPRSRRL